MHYSQNQQFFSLGLERCRYNTVVHDFPRFLGSLHACITWWIPGSLPTLVFVYGWYMYKHEALLFLFRRLGIEASLIR